VPRFEHLDYLCLRAYAAADIVALHAAARLTRKNVVGPVEHFSRGVATVAFDQMNIVSPVPVVSGYVFLGLAGSATSSSSSGANVQAYAEVYVNGTSVPCPGGACAPFQIPNFDGSLRVELWAFVSVGQSDELQVDATADADFVDTLTIQAIELHDASDQKIPDAVVTLTDQNDNVTLTFPNTVQAATTSTTTISTATTSTTIAPPGGCEVAATYASIECRLAALDALVKTSAGKLAAKLSNNSPRRSGASRRPRSPARRSACRQGSAARPRTRSEATTRCSARRRPRRRSTTRHARAPDRRRSDRDRRGEACRRRSRRTACDRLHAARSSAPGRFAEQPPGVFDAHGALDRHASVEKA
jgi:hypothetical protein